MYFMVCTRRHSKESNLISLRCWCKIHFFCLSSESSLFDFVFIFVSNPKMVFQPTKPCFESFLPQTMLNNLLYIIAQRSSYLSLQMNQLTSIHSWMITIFHCYKQIDIFITLCYNSRMIQSMPKTFNWMKDQ